MFFSSLAVASFPSYNVIAPTGSSFDFVSILSAGAKVDAATATGDTALTYACENGHTGVAEVLLDYGAELVSALCYKFDPKSKMDWGP